MRALRARLRPPCVGSRGEAAKLRPPAPPDEYETRRLGCDRPVCSTARPICGAGEPFVLNYRCVRPRRSWYHAVCFGKRETWSAGPGTAGYEMLSAEHRRELATLVTNVAGAAAGGGDGDAGSGARKRSPAASSAKAKKRAREAGGRASAEEPLPKSILPAVLADGRAADERMQHVPDILRAALYDFQVEGVRHGMVWRALPRCAPAAPTRT